MVVNDIKSQNDLTQPETHSTEVLLSTIEELERTKKQLAIAVEALDSLRGICFPQRAEKALEQIKELEK